MNLREGWEVLQHQPVCLAHVLSVPGVCMQVYIRSGILVVVGSHSCQCKQLQRARCFLPSWSYAIDRDTC